MILKDIKQVAEDLENGTHSEALDRFVQHLEKLGRERLLNGEASANERLFVLGLDKSGHFREVLLEGLRALASSTKAAKPDKTARLLYLEIELMFLLSEEAENKVEEAILEMTENRTVH